MGISYGSLLARATALLTVTAGLLTLANVATSQVSDSSRPTARPMTVAGCLVSERDYAAARGLARPLGSADTQLVIVLAKDAAREVLPDIAMDGIALTGRQEAALAGDAGRQITLDGMLEPPLTASPTFAAREPENESASSSPSGAVGTTPAGSPVPTSRSSICRPARRSRRSSTATERSSRSPRSTIGSISAAPSHRSA